MNKLIFKYEVIDFIAIIYNNEHDNKIYIIINKNLKKSIQKRIKRTLSKLLAIDEHLGFLFIVKGCGNEIEEKKDIQEERFE